MAAEYLSALSNLSQNRKKTIFEYSHRARLLVLKAYPNLSYLPRERILITSFLPGHYDSQIAASIDVVKI